MGGMKIVKVTHGTSRKQNAGSKSIVIYRYQRRQSAVNPHLTWVVHHLVPFFVCDTPVCVSPLAPLYRSTRHMTQVQK